jgi:hypothetical protein
LLVFFPNNRTEVDDGFWYAEGVRDGAYLDLFNPRFFLFLPVMKLFYDTLLLMHIHVDAYLMMCTVSMIFSGLTIVLLYDILAAQLDIGKKTALVASIAVLISYEYWRYSYEAEVYIISIFLILLAFRWFMITKKQEGYLHAIMLAMLCAFTTLLYKPNFIPLFVAFPLIFLYFGKIKELVAFYITGAVIIIGSFALVYSYLPDEPSFLSYLFGGTNSPTGKPYMSIFVIASNIISVLWLFSTDSAVSFIVKEFPHKVIQEEIYLARQIDGYEFILWICLGLMLLILSVMIVRALIGKLTLSSYQKKAVATVVIWLIIYGSFLMIMDPSSNEPWLMVQVPILILISVLFVKPLKATRLWLVYSLLFILFINNSVGGMWLLRSSSYDYNKLKIAWLIENTGSDDIILSYGPISFIRYLRYKTKATVIDIEEDSEVAMEVLGNYKSADIYLTEDVLYPPKAILYRSPKIVDNINGRFKELEIKTVVVSSGEFVTYRLE